MLAPCAEVPRGPKCRKFGQGELMATETLRASSGIVTVTAFIDWNSQIHAAAPPQGCSEIEIASRTLEYVSKKLCSGLKKIEQISKFDVTLRIYHGWHRGFEETPRKKAITIASAGATSLSDRPLILIRPDVEFGDRLVSANVSRLHARINCHVPNTLRKSLKSPDNDEEKMVDTAIAADVVDLAYRDPARWLVIVGEDDDLIPPLMVADGVRGLRDGKVVLFRQRGDTPFFKISDIRMTP